MLGIRIVKASNSVVGLSAIFYSQRGSREVLYRLLSDPTGGTLSRERKDWADEDDRWEALTSVTDNLEAAVERVLPKNQGWTWERFYLALLFWCEGYTLARSQASWGRPRV